MASPDFFANIFRSIVDPNSLPYRATIAVTKECHSKCQNCGIWKTKKSPEELTADEFEKIAFHYRQLRWLSLTGGEPTDRIDLPEITAKFSKTNPLYIVNFSTNGLNSAKVLASAQKIAELNIPKLIVAVSMDGPCLIHDKIRGIKGSFKKSAATLKELLSLEQKINSSSLKTKLKVFASLTLFSENQNAVPALIEELNEIEGFTIDRLHINIATTSKHFYANAEMKLENFSARAAIQHILKKRPVRLTFQEYIERTYQRLAVQYSENRRSPLPCSALKASFHLDELGNVYPCTVWDNPLGNVRRHNYSIKKILNGEKARQTKSDAFTRNCPNCWSPCEAYQTIASNPIRSLVQSVLPL
jgi:radical SAM protein with 4Fe4S-binding SPASM domain